MKRREFIMLVGGPLDFFWTMKFYPPKIKYKIKPHTTTINTNPIAIAPQFRFCP
jgi:hypothetical protein